MAFLASTFRAGVHPAEHKERTEKLSVERMPFAGRYVLPLGQHIGAPSTAIVSPGDKVTRGQVLATAGGFVSTVLHSPVTGTVNAIASRRHPNGSLVPAIEIDADTYASQDASFTRPTDWRELSTQDFVETIKQAGMVGLGGAAFPSHVKYAPPKGKSCETLVINGCECEPYLTCDHRVMVERAEAVLDGTEIVRSKLKAKEAVIGVEVNKKDAIKTLQAAIGTRPIRVVGLPVKYPQGAEKMLINALFGSFVPPGKLPIDLGIVVNNVSTMAAIADYFDKGQPLIERVVTVSGPGVIRPANLIVPIGTSVRDVLSHCHGLSEDVEMIVMGGPMMGSPIASLDVPVLKGTSGLLAFTKRDVSFLKEYPCIRCGRCLEACAQFLNPSQFARLARANLHEESEDSNIWDCMECGACSFACPSGIPIVQLIRHSKAHLRDQRKPKG